MVGFCKLLSALALLIHLFYDALFVTLSRIRNFRRLESRARLLKPGSRNLAKFRIYHSKTLRSHNCTRLHHGYGAFKDQSRLHEDVVIGISQSEQTYCKFNSNDKNTDSEQRFLGAKYLDFARLFLSHICSESVSVLSISISYVSRRVDCCKYLLPFRNTKSQVIESIYKRTGNRSVSDNLTTSNSTQKVLGRRGRVDNRGREN